MKPAEAWIRKYAAPGGFGIADALLRRVGHSPGEVVSAWFRVFPQCARCVHALESRSVAACMREMRPCFGCPGDRLRSRPENTNAPDDESKPGRCVRWGAHNNAKVTSSLARDPMNAS
jgi:hypothetical protein